MFGFLKKLLGGADAARSAADEEEVVLEISPQDLDAPDRLGPKIAAYARLRDDIETADYDPDQQAVRLRFRSGIESALFLAQVQAVLRQAPDGQAVVDHLDRALTEPVTEVDAEGYLLPVLKAPDYVAAAKRQMQAMGAGDTLPFWHQTLRTGLTVILVSDTPQMMRSLSEDDLAAMDLDTDAARMRAMQDLARFCHEGDLQVGSRDGKLFQLKLDGNYEASTYFLSSIWDDVATEFGAPPAALFAARDIVIYANSTDPEAMALLTAVAAPGAEPPPYAIAPDRLLIWTDDGWAPLDPTTEPSGRPN